MKQSIYPSLFIGAILIISLSLWDYFALRMLDGISKSIEQQHLMPAIVGAVLLLISPLFEQSVPKWLIYFIILFLTLTLLLWLSMIQTTAISDAYYTIRHLAGSLLIGILLFLNICQLKQGEPKAK